MDLAEKLLDDLTAALDMFGTFAFDDKGASEVMNPWAAALRALSGEDAGSALALVLDAEERRADVRNRADVASAGAARCPTVTQPKEDTN